MHTDVFDELLAFSHLPLARLPRASLTAWFAFLRGKQSMDGVPIPAHELAVGPLLRPALGRVEPGRLQLAVNDLLTWLTTADTVDRSAALTQPDLAALTVLLDVRPELNALFVVNDARLEFRSEIPGTTRTDIVHYVRARYRPFVRRQS